MDIQVTSIDGQPKHAIMSLTGDLDGSNYREVIAATQSAYDNGTRYLLIDMRGVPFMGSAGLVALHSAALILRGTDLPNAEDGWSAFHELGNDIESGIQPHLRILKPQSSVARGLKKTGMDQFIAIYEDKDEALTNFGA